MSADYSWKPTNRQSIRDVKSKGLFWCPCCDMAKVSRYGKCPVCRKIVDKKRKRGS